MNARQLAFYSQAVSDWQVYGHFRPAGSLWQSAFPVCHALHYLQMCTEKLAKAYYPTNLGTRISHNAFRRFLTDLPSNSLSFAPLGFADLASCTRWQLSVANLVGAIEDLAPALAVDRPNPEYPWPRNAPATAPVDYSFRAEVFDLLDAQAACGEPAFLAILGRMVATMRTDSWHL